MLDHPVVGLNLVEPKSRGAPARPLDTAISRKKPIGAAIKMKWATHYFVFSTLIIDYTKQGKAVLAGLCAGDRTPRATPPVSVFVKWPHSLRRDGAR